MSAKKRKIIASLTSYGSRIETVHLAIETILNQTKKADRVVLWLSKDEFSDDNLPQSLKNLSDHIDIEYCKDIKSYKKLIPAIEKYSEEIIITFDDDLFYEDDIIEKLYQEYIKDPHCIHCVRGHKMRFDDNKNLISYNKWDYCSNNFEKGYDIFPTSGAGTLFPPNSLYKDICKEELFTKLAPTADDVWFKAMSLLNNTKCKIVKQENNKYMNLNFIEGTQDNGLCFVNIDEEKGNNKQIKQVFDHYDLYLHLNELLDNKKR